MSDEKPPRPRLMSRRDAARALGCSTTKVARLERPGVLDPIRLSYTGPAGHARPPRVRYQPEQVLALREELEPIRERRERRAAAERWSREEGEIAARVFEMLRRGRELRDIVIDLRVPPVAVRLLREEYLRTFERDDRERDEGRRRQEERAERRDHDRRAARQDKEDRLAREARLRRAREAAAVPESAGTAREMSSGGEPEFTGRVGEYAAGGEDPFAGAASSSAGRQRTPRHES